jgi:cysteine-rich repeat protein
MYMKKLSMHVLIVAVTIGLAAGQLFGAQYNAGSATMNLNIDSCETRTVSLDATGFGTSRLVNGGFLIQQTDGTRVAITDPVRCYDGELTPAVWDPGATKVPEPEGYPGGYYINVTNLGAGVTPSSNILICDVEFCGTAGGSSTVTIDTFPDPSFDTWVARDQTVYDSTVNGDTITVTVTGGAVCGNNSVETGEQCEDGNTAGGDCCSATCQFEPASSSCSDGNFCNGAETCDGAGECVAATIRLSV